MTFKRIVDKNKIPICKIMNVNIAAIDMDWLLNFTKEHITDLSGDYMCVSNVHTTVMAYEDENYRNIQNGGVMAIPDGGPLSSVGKYRGFITMSRTTGPSYMENIFKISVKNGYKHFFYGSTENTLKKIKIHVSKNFPEVKISGFYSPPFRQLSSSENDAVISMINELSPDFVWVGLGAPKQEIWMAEHQGKVKGFMVGVGAAFDYLAGNIERAPMWMQKNNLEWLYRLVQDPKRLFRRYLNTNLKFVWHAMIKGE